MGKVSVHTHSSARVALANRQPPIRIFLTDRMRVLIAVAIIQLCALQGAE